MMPSEDHYPTNPYLPDGRSKVQTVRATGAVYLYGPELDIAKLAKVRVLLEDGTITTFEDWDEKHVRRVQALNLAHARLWRVGVYLHPARADEDSSQHAKRLVASAARDVFRLPSRYVEYEIEDSYFATVFDLHVEGKGWPAGEREHVVRVAAEAAAKSKKERPTLEAAVRQIDETVAQGGKGGRRRKGRSDDAQATLPGT